MSDAVKTIMSTAARWDHKNIHVIPGAPKETCAFFVRFVFKEALHAAGEMPVAHTRPYYAKHNVTALPTNENFADGLAGDVIGPEIPMGREQPGDILLFKDTYYDGSFPHGSITHVGICFGNGMMADSSGGPCHVRPYKQGFFSDKLAEVRRPRCLGAAESTAATGISYDKGPVRARLNGAVTSHLELMIRLGKSTPKPSPQPKFSGFPKMPGTPSMGQMMSGFKPPAPPASATGLQVLANGMPIKYTYVTVDIVIGGQHAKLFSHKGQTKAFLDGHETQSFEVEATLSGMLHVRLNGKEVKPSSVNIGIS